MQHGPNDDVIKNQIYSDVCIRRRNAIGTSNVSVKKSIDFFVLDFLLYSPSQNNKIARLCSSIVST